MSILCNSQSKRTSVKSSADVCKNKTTNNLIEKKRIKVTKTNIMSSDSEDEVNIKSTKKQIENSSSKDSDNEINKKQTKHISNEDSDNESDNLDNESDNESNDEDLNVLNYYKEYERKLKNILDDNKIKYEIVTRNNYEKLLKEKKIIRFNKYNEDKEEKYYLRDFLKNKYNDVDLKNLPQDYYYDIYIFYPSSANNIIKENEFKYNNKDMIKKIIEKRQKRTFDHYERYDNYLKNFFDEYDFEYITVAKNNYEELIKEEIIPESANELFEEDDSNATDLTNLDLTDLPKDEYDDIYIYCDYVSFEISELYKNDNIVIGRLESTLTNYRDSIKIKEEENTKLKNKAEKYKNKYTNLVDEFNKLVDMYKEKEKEVEKLTKNKKK